MPFQIEGGSNFGKALQILKEAATPPRRVTRTGWYGKGQWLFLVHEGFLSGRFGEISAPFIAIHTAEKTIVPWVASQTDLLAEDWFEVM